MNNELLYQLALSFAPNIGDIHAKALLNIYGDAESIFKAPKRHLEKIEGIGSIRANSIKSFSDFDSCETEMAYMEAESISPLFITSAQYPKRLLNCYDSPVILYYKGNTDLNNTRILSVVGTRKHSDYGRAVCEKILEDLKGQDILVVSGLAFGIDTIAHKGALKNGLPTVGVLAHGLNMIYPAQNTSLANQICEHGGLLTDFRSTTIPDKGNFPKRNRIVAGMCDALLLIESGIKGGSLITADLANSYNKDVFAIPGRTTDSKSEGCNYCIRNHKALLVTCADDILQIMNWKPVARPAKQPQRQLFIELTAEEKAVLAILEQQGFAHVDEIYGKTGLSSSAVASALLILEMQNIIVCLPGKQYKMV